MKLLSWIIQCFCPDSNIKQEAKKPLISQSSSNRRREKWLVTPPNHDNNSNSDIIEQPNPYNSSKESTEESSKNAYGNTGRTSPPVAIPKPTHFSWKVHSVPQKMLQKR